VTRTVTAESVTAGHPDKVCDQIADAILDHALAVDPQSRVAVEVAAKGDQVWIFGEMTTAADVPVEDLARRTIDRIGYRDASIGLDAAACSITVSISQQSPDIAQAVDQAERLQQGAGDQGLMVGHASADTPHYLPLPIAAAQSITRAMTAAHRDGRVGLLDLPWLRPDGKAQVTVAYGADGQPSHISSIVASAQHHPDISVSAVRDALETIVRSVVDQRWITTDTDWHLQPSGRFVIGGTAADSGLTGRKIVADTYGGSARHGGGAFSGKDASKVDRSGAYAARWLAKNIVASGMAQVCDIEIAYAIGVARPVAVSVDTHGTGHIDDAEMRQRIIDRVDLRPAAVIERLGLLGGVQYASVATGGHFGRPDLWLPWETLDISDAVSR
jgi:S-adenosylmethionine synthetase